MEFDFTIRTKQDLIDAVVTFGIVPFFRNSIPGFSIEVDDHGRQRKALRHRRARAVHAQKRDRQIPRGKGGTHALVQQIPREQIVDVRRRELRLVTAERKAL